MNTKDRLINRFYEFDKNGAFFGRDVDDALLKKEGFKQAELDKLHAGEILAKGKASYFFCEEDGQAARRILANIKRG